jgi:hypothetical protein
MRMSFTKFSAALVLASSSFAVSGQAVFVNKAEGFVDINIPLTNDVVGGSAPGAIHASGSNGQGKVGLVLEILPDWKEQRERNTVVYWGYVRLRRSGAESDSFIRLLFQSYALKSPANEVRMIDQITLPAVALEGNPSSPRNGNLRMKLFYEGRTPESYAEVYANINNQTKVFEFHEKDTSYRTQLVSALSASKK